MSVTRLLLRVAKLIGGSHQTQLIAALASGLIRLINETGYA